jgi:drug/metabolite transporter (DMT)-like permease
MARRLGIVFWWAGAILIALGILILFNGSSIDKWITAEVFGLPAIVCWTISYLLAGSFWRPVSLIGRQRAHWF